MKLLAEMAHHHGQVGCLNVLARTGQSSPSQLAESLHVSKPTVAAMLGRMETAGLIERATDPDDQRRVTVSLTEPGAEAARAVSEAHGRFARDVLSGLDEAERIELVRLLSKIADTTEALLDEGRTAAEGEPR